MLASRKPGEPHIIDLGKDAVARYFTVTGEKPANKAAKAPKKAAKAKAQGAREGSKTAKVLDLLKRPRGA